MPALNFKPQFAPMVRAGMDPEFAKANPGIRPKLQTIRATRKYPVKIGDTLYLYTGMRTKNCRKLGEVYCQSAREIRIECDSFNAYHDEYDIHIYLADDYGRLWEHPYYSISKIISDDGFDSKKEFLNFFETTHGLPFTGQLIKW